MKDQIESALQQYLQNGKYFVVDVKVSLSKVQSKVLILIDSDEGITIDECGEISHEIGKDLDEIMTEKYRLEVSSPGVDFPLKFDRQYRKNVGRNLKVIFTDGQTKTGKLESVDNQQITLLEDRKLKKGEVNKPIVIQFSEIKQAQVLISFK
jgi:ribosome maturation factor RimP